MSRLQLAGNMIIYSHVRLFLSTMAASMLKLAYGYNLEDFQDPIFTNAQLAVDHIVKAGMFTSKSVDQYYSNLCITQLERLPQRLFRQYISRHG